MVRLHHAVLRVYGRSFNERQQVSLHAFARNIRALSAGTASNFIEFVEEHDAMLFRCLQCLGLELFLIHHLRGFFVGQMAKCFFNLEFASLAAVTAEVLKHPL